MSVSRRVRALASVLAVTFGVSVFVTSARAPIAWAEEPTSYELEAARESFKEGLALEKAGQYAEAIAKFEATKRVKATPQVRFHIALCQERLGRWIDAADGYEAAAKQAAFEGSAPEVSKVAPELARKLRQKIPRLTIVVSGGPAKALAIDGRAIVIEDAQRMPLDPGKHVVTANDQSWNTAKVEITLGEGDDKSVSIVFVPPPKTVLKESTGNEPPPYKATPLERPSRSYTGPLVVGGLGVVGLGVGFVFLGLRGKQVSDLDAQCPDRKCPSSAQSDIDRAHTYTTISRIGFGAGIVGVGVAVVMLAAGGSSAPPQTGKLLPWSPSQSVGLGVQGAF